ncbi:class F sortase [Nonomuraea sp. NPDC050663]|uniref:class F sortase n=1 Tax=Nonomuraea sp. NPDC050663 TaxID=3364370 RepID=UPI0037B9B039
MTARILTEPPSARPPSVAIRPWAIPAPAQPLPAVPSQAPAASRPAQPVQIVIPAIGVSAPITSVGLDSDGVVQAPSLSEPNLTGWYRHGPRPGENGPAVILGHLDTVSGPAVFARLGELQANDPIIITTADGSQETFIVTSREQVAKNAFPTSRVYGPVSAPALRLITCGGDFDHAKRSYNDNIIIYASHR